MLRASVLEEARSIVAATADRSHKTNRLKAFQVPSRRAQYCNKLHLVFAQPRGKSGVKADHSFHECHKPILDHSQGSKLRFQDHSLVAIEYSQNDTAILAAV